MVVNDLTPYGSQRVAMSLVEQWAPSRRVVLVTLEAPTARDLTVPEGVGLHRLRRSGPRAWALLSLAWQLRRVIADERPRSVLAHMTFATTITLLASLGTRTRPVVVEHNLLSRNLAVQGGGRVTRWLLRRLHPVAGLFIGVSDAVVDDVYATAGVPRSRLRRIYNPVPERAPRRGGELHPWLAPGRPGTVLTCVGGFRRAKGQDVLLEALAQLVARGTIDVRVVLLGDGLQEQDRRDQARALGIDGRVHFAGYREDAVDWVAASDVLVMPSRWDSFGLVAVEAARCGVPVLASDVPGLREVVPVYAPGWSVPPGRADLLADQIERIVGGEAPIAASGDLATFSPAVVAAQYEQVLAEQDGRRS